MCLLIAVSCTAAETENSTIDPSSSVYLSAFSRGPQTRFGTEFVVVLPCEEQADGTFISPYVLMVRVRRRKQHVK
ncbi:hypothetical protein BJY01DRAFT_201297 [Aspergillus pseudoustus]|uniref:Secreted protein n=1 Tax=Aspergillus pseudoustus TaxID=1810923 RepID=A0ABR4L1W1_9EURO